MKFLTTKAISAEIEGIIRKAQKEIIIISPYVKLYDIWRNRLKEASEKKIEIKFVFGKEKDQLEKAENVSVKGLSKIKFYFFENLHAKCYMNESMAIITSMNLHSYSEQNNWEMGILIEKGTETEIYKEIYRETQSILNFAEPYKNNLTKQAFGCGNNSRQQSNSFQCQNDTGFCIRCGKRIFLNPDRPFCPKCFAQWNEFKNEEYQENYCHQCGRTWRTCMERPLCISCWNNF